MKLLITGARSITDFDLDKYVPEETELIISSGDEGIDSLAEKYADEHKISKLILRPNRIKYGNIADAMLNYEMVNLADRILIIWDEKCEKAKKSIDVANKRFKSATVINVK